MSNETEYVVCFGIKCHFVRHKNGGKYYKGEVEADLPARKSFLPIKVYCFENQGKYLVRLVCGSESYSPNQVGSRLRKPRK